jgi:hypothetical protein
MGAPHRSPRDRACGSREGDGGLKGGVMKQT